MSLNHDCRNVNLRRHPEKYKIGRGEMGVLTAGPYKSEILPDWRFGSPEKAKISAEKIYAMFQNYGSHDDFMGTHTARLFHEYYARAKQDPIYLRLKTEHKEKYE